MKQIKLGYKVPTGEEIFINPSHLIVTGITQQSGKTTTLEALIHRSKSKAIVFKTKVGEKSFNTGTHVPPFFRDRSDYDFVRSLIEAYSKEKLFIEKGTLMTLCKGSSSLTEIEKRINDKLFPADAKAKPPTGINLEIYTRLQHYLEQLIPQIKYAKFSSTLNLVDGINIMDLEQFSFEAQSLIIRSVADEVLKNGREIIIVIPEAWKFLPQKGNNPCKGAVESFIRQGATNNNFIWVDSQEMASVDKTPLKQISTWILGYQAERNEVSHTLDQISLPKKMKPKEEEIMNLKIGHFFLSSRDDVVQVYVQPVWLSDEDALLVAMGKRQIEEAMIKQPMPSFNFQQTAIVEKPNSVNNGTLATKKEIIELRMDIFKKIETLISDVKNYVEGKTSGNVPEIDIDDVVSQVLQKMPAPNLSADFNNTLIDVKEMKRMIEEQVSKLKMSGSVTYTVAPLEKIKKDFLVEAKEKIIKDVKELSKDEQKLLKYMEIKENDVTPNEIVTKCFMLSVGGSSSVKISNLFKELLTSELVEKTAGGRYRRGLKKKIVSFMGNHDATSDEIENVYNHILMEVIDK